MSAFRPNEPTCFRTQYISLENRGTEHTLEITLRARSGYVYPARKGLFSVSRHVLLHLYSSNLPMLPLV